MSEEEKTEENLSSGEREGYTNIPKFFINQYNLENGTEYEFECWRESMFSLPKYRLKNVGVWEMAFIEGKKRSSFVADLMVFSHLQKRLIIEYAKLIVGEEGEPSMPAVNYISTTIDRMEYLVLKEITCSKYLLIDITDFLRIRMVDPDAYKEERLRRDRMIKQSEKNGLRDLEHGLGIPLKHWFKKIWILYYNEKGDIRCRQIW